MRLYLYGVRDRELALFPEGRLGTVLLSLRVFVVVLFDVGRRGAAAAFLVAGRIRGVVAYDCLNCVAEERKLLVSALGIIHTCSLVQ